MTELKVESREAYFVRIEDPKKPKCPYNAIFEDKYGTEARFASWSEDLIRKLKGVAEGRDSLRCKLTYEVRMFENKPSYTLKSVESVDNPPKKAASKPETTAKKDPELKKPLEDLVMEAAKEGIKQLEQASVSDMANRINRIEQNSGLERSEEIPLNYRDSADLSMKDALWLILSYQKYFKTLEIGNEEAFRTIFGTIAIQRGKETYQRRSEKARGMNDES